MRPGLLCCAFWLLISAGSASALLESEVSRDPDGIRRSVVMVESGNGEFCSGALIGPNLVLTAAHCVSKPARYRVVAVDRLFQRQVIKAVAAAVHPGFISDATPRTQTGPNL